MTNNEYELYTQMTRVHYYLRGVNENIGLLRDYLEKIKVTISFEEAHSLGGQYSKCIYYFNEAFSIAERALEELNPKKE